MAQEHRQGDKHQRQKRGSLPPGEGDQRHRKRGPCQSGKNRRPADDDVLQCGNIVEQGCAGSTCIIAVHAGIDRGLAGEQAGAQRRYALLCCLMPEQALTISPHRAKDRKQPDCGRGDGGRSRVRCPAMPRPAKTSPPFLPNSGYLPEEFIMPLEYQTLRVTWWALKAVLLIGFALSDGFDLGAVSCRLWCSGSRSATC